MSIAGIAQVAYAPQIAAAAQRHHLDPALLAAVAAQETGGPGADSGANVVGDGGHGHGLFQIDDRWHPFAETPAAMDPAKNADYAAGLLAGLLKTYGGNVHAALSAYNAGSPAASGTTTDWGNGKVVGYADSVLMHYARLGGVSARDAQVADLAGTSAAVNELRSYAATPSPAQPSATAPALPAQPPHSQAQPAPLDEDLGGDDAGDPSQTPAVA